MQSHALTLPTSLLIQLREDTSDIHEALHRHPLLIALGEGRAGKQELRAVLPAFYGFHAACDERFGQHRLPGFTPSPHRTWLEADLHAHGFDASRIANLPRCPGIPVIASPGDVLGHLYVREGATLGGQSIARHLSRQLGDDGAGYRFFTGHGPKETGARWRSFVASLEAAPSSAAADAVRTAVALFSALEAWLWTCYRVPA